MDPRVFISYSWSSPEHQLLVQSWAERLVEDGIDVVLDAYDLKEGHDKYAFMERMVTDKSVTHVLVISESEYARKADEKTAGVGTESQIISQVVYESVEQSKFIPIVCEFDEGGKACLPTFLKSRIWIDFSTPEAVNAHWERLVRLLYGKPAVQKPELGKRPAYIDEDSEIPTSPAVSRFNALRQAVSQGSKRLSPYRRDFLDACIEYADRLRVRDRPDVESLGAKVLEDCGKLKGVRNLIVDWVLLESEVTPAEEYAEELLVLLERLLELKSRPPEMNTWSDSWFEAHSMFVYETFLYVVASLIKTGSFEVLHEVFTSHYLLPESGLRRSDFDSFDAFYGHSETLQAVLAPEGRKLLSPAAELIKRQADRSDVPFPSVIEAELLVVLMSFITPDTRWYPQTLIYAGYGRSFPFFVRASQHKYFAKLAIVTGIADVDELRQAVKDGQEREGVSNWRDFSFDREFWSSMNMDKLDSIK